MWILGDNPVPAALPLDLASEVVPFLRLTSDEAAAQDALLTATISGARAACETFTGRPLITRTVKLWGDHWFDSGGVYSGGSSGRGYSGGPYGRLRLPLPGVSSITSITYLDTNGVRQTWDSSTGWDKVLPTGEQAGRAEVFLRFAQIFPTARCQPGSIEITYTTGYGTSFASIPGRLKQGMLLYIGEAYGNRELMSAGRIAENPVSAERCWWPFRCF